MEINDLVKTVELAIVEMGLSKEESQADEQGQWILLKNETPIYIDAWDDKQSTPWNYFIFEQDKTVFQITVPFCYGPTVKRAEFLEELLVVNTIYDAVATEITLDEIIAENELTLTVET